MAAYALLADNDERIEARLEQLRRRLPPVVRPKVCAAMVIGSDALGRARDESDIDLVLVLNEGGPRRSDYTWWDETAGPALELPEKPFPVHPLFLSRESLRTEEPQLRAALQSGIPLWDPEGCFDDQSEARP